MSSQRPNRKTRIKKRHHKRAGARKPQRLGAAVVEFAVVANVLFIVIFTCIEFTRINLIRNTAQDAAYYAARKAMVTGATNAEAEAVANGLLNSVGTNGAVVSINNGQEIDADTSTIEVEITINYADNALFAPLFIGDQNFVARSNMRTERYDLFFEG